MSLGKAKTFLITSELDNVLINVSKSEGMHQSFIIQRALEAYLLNRKPRLPENVNAV